MAKIDLFQEISAPREKLFPYLGSARGLSSWHADEVKGSLEEGVFTLRWPTLGAELRLRVRSSVPLERVVLEAGDSLVTLSLERGGVSLVHDGLTDDDDLPGFRSSWSLALALLRHAVLHHPGETRKVNWAFETLTLSPELAHFYFATALGLGKWLGTSRNDIGDPGTSIALDLGKGVTLSGEVLAHEPGRDLVLAWKELGNAALVLRTLPAAGDQRTLTLSLSSWDGRDHSEVIGLLNNALKRLREALRSIGRS